MSTLIGDKLIDIYKIHIMTHKTITLIQNTLLNHTFAIILSSRDFEAKQTQCFLF
jgi:hypothetical protein